MMVIWKFATEVHGGLYAAPMSVAVCIVLLQLYVISWKLAVPVAVSSIVYYVLFLCFCDYSC